MRLFKRKRGSDEDSTTRRRIQSDIPSAMRPSSTFSYYTNRTEETSNVGRDIEKIEGREQKQESLFRKIFMRALVIVVILAVLAFVINSILLNPNPKIVALTTPSNRIFLGDTTAYRQSATRLLNQFENRNKLTINVNQISASMLQQFPELANVTVSLPVVGHNPVVYVQPSEPSMILSMQSGASYVLDGQGKALVNASAIGDTLAKLQIPIVQMQNNVAVKLGETVLPTNTVKFIQTVSQQLASMHIPVSSMAMPKGASELDVFISGQPFYGKFNTEDDSALQQSGTFIVTYRHLLNTGKLPKQYIDVRVDDRAYYK